MKIDSIVVIEAAVCCIIWRLFYLIFSCNLFDFNTKILPDFCTNPR
jgi:hypothetical protein